MALGDSRPYSSMLTSRGAAVALMERKGFDSQAAATVRLVEKGADATIRRREGLVERVAYGPRSVAWQLKPA